MPTYDYRCRDCGHTLEIMHSMQEDGPEACERCRGPVDRVMHPAGVIFRGSGFYVTDSRRGSSTSESSSGDGGGDSTGGSKAAPKASDTKASDTKASDTKASDTKASKDSSRSSGGPEGSGGAD